MISKILQIVYLCKELCSGHNLRIIHCHGCVSCVIANHARSINLHHPLIKFFLYFKPSAIASISLTGVTGKVTMDANADRITEYWVWQLPHGNERFEPVLVIDPDMPVGQVTKQSQIKRIILNFLNGSYWLNIYLLRPSIEFFIGFVDKFGSY